MSAFKFGYPKQLFANLFSTTSQGKKEVYQLQVDVDLYMHDASMFGSGWRDAIAVYQFVGFKTLEELEQQCDQTSPQVLGPCISFFGPNIP
jgi:hypothetical protein